MNIRSVSRYSWQTPKNLLTVMTIAMTVAFATWIGILNNFVVEEANFTGADIGTLQSVREIPGFLAFSVIFLLFFLKEQPLAYLSLLFLGVGVAITGFFPHMLGLMLATLLMSTGFHFYETVKQSLSLQWLSIEEAPKILGQLIAVGSLTSLAIYGFLWLSQDYLNLSFTKIYIFTGGCCVFLTMILAFSFPHFEGVTPQRKNLVLKKRYWLYYALTFMGGARRQIFVVFAGFLMVEKFSYSVADVAALYMINHAFNWFFAKKIGILIGKFGERNALTFEYIGLICVFTAYAFVSDARWAAILYVLDHLFFSLAIAIKTYFQKIADPADMASTAGVAFTINHVAAVFIPVLFGLVWMISPTLVFLMGATLATTSLFLARNIPTNPSPGNEVLLGKVRHIITDKIS
ncbi:MAG: MFS transporter [Cellvibrionales bacterium TMED49]|nr:MFS transporter [Porticoccaceae bacterium]OUU35027.1 MAG: MFS transporter [Cellvibrionales bacterium TMED49]